MLWTIFMLLLVLWLPGIELVHFGRVHSHSSAGSDSGCADSRDSGTQSGPLRGFSFLERSFR